MRSGSDQTQLGEALWVKVCLAERYQHIFDSDTKSPNMSVNPPSPSSDEDATSEGQPDLDGERTLLLVDDDKPFLNRLGRAMETRGFEVRLADSVAEGLAQVRSSAPAFAVVDMRLEDGNGLDVVAELRKVRPEARAVVLTGYGNIATAVSAVKLGATDYLAKPADADMVEKALLQTSEGDMGLPENPMSADRVRWEHIQRVYEMCDRNVSETARRLNMHRRTLQRILAKRAPR